MCVYIYNSRMQSEGFSFIFGGLGVEVCSVDVACRWQPSATVRNGEDMVVPVANLRKLWFLKVLQDVTCSFVAGVVLGDIPTCEIACRKSLCVTGAILLNDFRKITVQWHWCGFVRRVWHVATFPRVDDMCRKSFCVTGEILLNDFRKITVIFVASAALQRCLFLVAGTVLYTCGVVCICKSYLNCLCIHIKWQKGNVLTLFSDYSNHPVWFPRH